MKALVTVLALLASATAAAAGDASDLYESALSNPARSAQDR